MLEQEYADMAEDIHDFGNKGEKHPEEVTGEEVDEHLEKTDDFIRRMHQLVSEMGARKKVQNLVDDYKQLY
ncbi:hypothetical protein HRED_08860 [Candidatus Haloredivivus sp. G17]|nr:hypothetical protein HRED_08860 [Candidatus Haloredivivus sp. G17]